MQPPIDGKKPVCSGQTVLMSSHAFAVRTRLTLYRVGVKIDCSHGLGHHKMSIYMFNARLGVVTPFAFRFNTADVGNNVPTASPFSPLCTSSAYNVCTDRYIDLPFFLACKFTTERIHQTGLRFPIDFYFFNAPVYNIFLLGQYVRTYNSGPSHDKQSTSQHLSSV